MQRPLQAKPISGFLDGFWIMLDCGAHMLLYFNEPQMMQWIGLQHLLERFAAIEPFGSEHAFFLSLAPLSLCILERLKSAAIWGMPLQY
jgi:hypothetical protein